MADRCCYFFNLTAAVGLVAVKGDQRKQPVLVDIFLTEDIENIGAGDLFACGIGNLLHGFAELNFSAARQTDMVIGFEQIGDAALARLRIDPDDRFKGTAYIRGINRQMGTSQ